MKASACAAAEDRTRRDHRSRPSHGSVNTVFREDQRAQATPTMKASQFKKRRGGKSVRWYRAGLGCMRAAECMKRRL
eukprot:6181993-Pleurochrysis_carterae.AAC.2